MYQIMAEKQNWMEAELSEIKDLLEAKAKAKQTALDSGKNTADNIMSQIVDGGG